jgi:hypothetical protein
MSLLQLPQQGITALQSGRTYIDDIANKYLVKPDDMLGVGGFLFDYESETTVTHQADITDHYTENNTAIQDHIAIKPLKITLRGFVAELKKSKPAGLTGALQLLTTGLSTVPAYLGDYSPGVLQEMQEAAQNVQNTINTVDEVLGKAQNLVNMLGLGDKSGWTKQQDAYYELTSMMNTKQVMTVDTPFKFFDSMVIESLSFTQDETTKYIADITITLKQIRLASIKFSKLDKDKYAGAAASQRQDPTGPTKEKGNKVTMESGLHFALYGGS